MFLLAMRYPEVRDWRDLHESYPILGRLKDGKH
jgi:hypothetical protein